VIGSCEKDKLGTVLKTLERRGRLPGEETGSRLSSLTAISWRPSRRVLGLRQAQAARRAAEQRVRAEPAAAGHADPQAPLTRSGDAAADGDGERHTGDHSRFGAREVVQQRDSLSCWTVGHDWFLRRLLGRPGGFRVCVRPSRRAVRRTQASGPNGRMRGHADLQAIQTP
jgi:hypothetical protein